MTNPRLAFLISLVLLASPALRGQATESSINKQLKALTAVPAPPGAPSATDASKPVGIPDAQRPATIIQLAKDISSLPAGPGKLKLADALLRASTPGEVGLEALQAAANTLAQALTESPQPEKDGNPAPAYAELARLARFAQIATSLKDPELAKAGGILAANDADIAKADFTLKDLNGKKVTFSALKGKIVLVNFWSTACPACIKEMQDLDLIHTHYQSQGLVILSITGDNGFRANQYLASKGYHPQVIADDGGKVGKMFHVDELHPEGLPRTFVFDRDGKLVGESLDMCTQRQFFVMLGSAGLKPAGSN